MTSRRFPVVLFLAWGVTGCGGLKYVPEAGTESEWRPLSGVEAGGAALARAEAQPPPAEVPFRPIQVRGAYVAIFDIQDKSHQLSPMEIDALTEYLAAKVSEGGLFQVVPRDEIKKRLRDQQHRSYRQCFDESCQIEVGREIAAQKTLSASISPIGTSCIITAGLFDLKKAATDATATTRGKCTKDALLAQLEEIIAKFRKMVI